jgi:hypothetical protein
MLEVLEDQIGDEIIVSTRTPLEVARDEVAIEDSGQFGH